MYIKQEEIDPLSPNNQSIAIGNMTSSPTSSDGSFSPTTTSHPHHNHIPHPFFHHHHPPPPVCHSHSHPHQHVSVVTTSSPPSRVKRLRANDRERRRVHLINCAMDELKEVVPGLKDKRKLTKLELLRAANQYIWMLDEALRTNRSLDQIQQRIEEPIPSPIYPSPPQYYYTTQPYYNMPKLRRSSSS